jgi:hypothetical protein
VLFPRSVLIERALKELGVAGMMTPEAVVLFGVLGVDVVQIPS